MVEGSAVGPTGQLPRRSATQEHGQAPADTIEAATDTTETEEIAIWVEEFAI
jgi:hypothetical protein